MLRGSIVFGFILLSCLASAQLSVDVETGIGFQSYNKVRVPNADGTLFDFNKDFEVQSPIIPTRLKAGYTFAEKNQVIVLFAPLAINYEGESPMDIAFKQTTFPENRTTEGYYKFNSYRITYRREVYQYLSWTVAVGVTAKVRDAVIRLSTLGASEEEKDFGFAPLLHLYAAYDIYKFAAFIEGDGFAVPSGRAFDFFAGLRVPIKDNVKIRAGYRILEGGADVNSVYNYTLINFINIGLNVQL